jgi:hypothetical protein
MYCGGLKEMLEMRTALLLGYYAASSGDVLPTFRDNISVPSSEVKNKKWDPIGSPETSVKNTTTGCVIIQKSTVLIYFAAED